MHKNTHFSTEKGRNLGEFTERLRELRRNHNERVESAISLPDPKPEIVDKAQQKEDPRSPGKRWVWTREKTQKEDPRSRGERLLWRRKNHLDAVCKKVTVTSFSESREECLSAALELIQKTEKAWKTHEKEILEVTRELEQTKPQVMTALLRSFGDLNNSFDEDEDKVEAKIDSLVNFYLSLEYSIAALEPRPANLRLQLDVHRLLREQNPSIVQSVTREVLNRYTCHLDRKPLRSRAKVGFKEDSKRIPYEVAFSIFSFCDLESCVALRNTNSFWFRMYSQAENILKPALQKRAPWLKPEGDVKTWADCVLVFVSRLTSDKCRRVDNGFVKKSNIPSAKPTKAVLSLQLLSDTMPAAFEGFDDHREFCCSAACDRLHLHNVKQGALMNPWTKEIESFTPRTMGFTRQTNNKDEEETVISFQNVEITLPGVVKETDLRPNGSFLRLPPIVVTSELVIVTTATDQFVLPRETPHYNNPDTLKFSTPPEYRSTIQFGDVFANISKHGLWIYDPHVKELVQVDNTSGTKHLFPIDMHAGLVWYIYNERCLVPTFTDKKTPDALYCHEDKIISLPTHVDVRAIRRCRRFENSHFLTIPGSRGSIYMVDLDSGVVTEVIPSEGHDFEGKAKIFLGWVDGKFQALDICTETVLKYMESHWKDGYSSDWDRYDYHSRFRDEHGFVVTDETWEEEEEEGEEGEGEEGEEGEEEEEEEDDDPEDYLEELERERYTEFHHYDSDEIENVPNSDELVRNFMPYR
ncbi:hypothetical protein CJU90_3889 [Yarrowia sp. C11]|nr:hypothetical protein CKK34_5500 [Yarrowia sp. E02]KAG5367589.1 hypothetical protein CJU90_3889 [Yarrowia sp. C11]